jgi:hypothetical protein
LLGELAVGLGVYRFGRGVHRFLGKERQFRSVGEGVE